MSFTRKEIEQQMLPEMDAIIAYWNEHGQIFERQFAFARNEIMKHYAEVVYDIMKDHGAYVFATADDDPDDEFAANGHFHTRHVNTPTEGWMRTFCSLAKVDYNDVEQNVIDFYETHSI